MLDYLIVLMCKFLWIDNIIKDFPVQSNVDNTLNHKCCYRAFIHCSWMARAHWN